MTKLKKERKIFNLMILALIVISLGMIPSSKDEGMYPLSEIHKLNLQEKGLKIDPLEVYNPNGVSIVDALVDVGGCTGSFVSENGLIITNHHCAFGSISRASTTENNYLENGFLAKTYEEEIPAQRVVVRITESYEEVSEEILNSVKGIEDPVVRSQKIYEKMIELSEKYTNLDESIEAEVSEMFEGKSYVLFKYRLIEDVRLVYAPPITIGNFGGETDNWVWPRHTGDFTFMRAYVAPNGKSAKYSKENIPFKPKRHLKVNPNGVQEGDFIFILGYPGRTYRHKPAEFLTYQEKYLLPIYADFLEYMINYLTAYSKDDDELKLAYASYIKGLANTMKNYKGKILGLKRTELYKARKKEEVQLQNFIDSDDKLKEKYGNLLNEINTTYDQLFEIVEANLWFNLSNRFSTLFALASELKNYATEIQKPNEERIDDYKDENLAQTKFYLYRLISNYNKEMEKAVWVNLFKYADNFSGRSKITAIENVKENKDAIVFLESEMLDAKFLNQEIFSKLLEDTPENILNYDDPVLQFLFKLKLQMDDIQNERTLIDGKLDMYSASLIEVKMLWKGTEFIPDANSTLRFTYGYIKGYTPADAIYYSPITTLKGVIDKSLYGNEDYKIHPKVKELYDKGDFGKFADKLLGSVPVAILYNGDTTGGNSGSPILNAYGELIGVNFDRAFEATINDFAWNESYSRSLGVDIRYVLWVTQKIGGADNIIKELGIE
ncbi:MAG: S46 family peptidase [Ignavibacteriales bacterium]|nr:S46 family peptidase [Ignavibacteriales bacterium]